MYVMERPQEAVFVNGRVERHQAEVVLGPFIWRKSWPGRCRP
jgi:hypothetical protein